MIRFRALGIHFSIPLLTLFIPLLAERLGMDLPFYKLSLALALHELAHLLAAKLVHVSILEIRLLPFGGSARMENPYGLRRAQLVLVSLSGPATNFLLALLFASLSQWGLWKAADAAEHVRINLTLFLFNLLPALPLDGGRTLYALLQRHIGQARAMTIGILLGRILAACMVLCAAYNLVLRHQINLSMLLAAVFILCSAQDERDAMREARVRHLTADAASILPTRFFQLPENAPASKALSLMRPGEASWFLISKKENSSSLLSGSSLLVFLKNGGNVDVPIGTLPAFTLSNNL